MDHSRSGAPSRPGAKRAFSKSSGVLLSLALGAGLLLAPSRAEAQQATFHLDRLEIPGSPDDGIAIYRPVTHLDAKGQPFPAFFAQLAMGYSLNPLHIGNITTDPTTLATSKQGVITDQFTVYGTVGAQFLDRIIASVSLPVTLIEAGNQPNYPSTLLGTTAITSFSTSGVAAGDTRIDLRFIALRSEDRKKSLGAHLSIFAPSGTTNNFGGDGSFSYWLSLDGEYTISFLTLVANTGIMIRPTNSINDPGHGSGLGVGDEWRWSVGAFIPIKQGKYRIGATIFGSTGIEDDSGSQPSILGNTVFTSRNTPIEWQGELRVKIGTPGDERFWIGGGAGSLINDGYGAPDFRVVALAGLYVPLIDTNPESPDRKLAHHHVTGPCPDRDHDGVCDDVDPCPDEPEDHLDPDPTDGCPAPKDRDHDGIPDDRDACPDVPGKPSSDPKKNGCPEDPDRDHDGVPNAQDACPDVPGKPNPDPKKNGCPTEIVVEGTTVRTLREVHFATGSAVLLPDSFPVLQEVVDLLKARPGIKRLRVEGHTDNVGGAAYNLGLSDARAASVRTWLTQHGIEAGRLESKGYGLTQPIADNATAAGRAKNRRVEFKILQEDNAPP